MPLWNVPYPRNPFFTGREELLAQLTVALKTKPATALTQPQAISGLGGIGKTQIAIEYAYRAQTDYQAVFWVRADTRENVIADFVTIAGLLELPEKDAQDQLIAVQAVKRWLSTHGKWLLILDNADELSMVDEFLPLVPGGHMLLTTWAHAMGRLAHHTAQRTARRKKKCYFYPGKTDQTAPNLVRELEQSSPTEIVFSDIFEVRLADGSPVRGCFALWKRTQHILAMAFDYRMQAELVVKTIKMIPFEVTGAIFHSDQGKQ